jgi:hypothetical protein
VIRYWLLIAVRSRALLAPVLAVAFVLAGVYAYKPNEAPETWALTALLACPLGAWLLAGAAHAEPAAAHEMRVAALGGRHRALRAELRAVEVIMIGLAALLVAYPLAIGAFTPAAGVEIVAFAAFAHALCAGLGGVLGLLAGTLTPGGAAVLVIATFLVSLAAEPALGPVAGPAGVADALAGEALPRLAVAAAACVLWAAAATALTARRRARS